MTAEIPQLDRRQKRHTRRIWRLENYSGPEQFGPGAKGRPHPIEWQTLPLYLSAGRVWVRLLANLANSLLQIGNALQI